MELFKMAKEAYSMKSKLGAMEKTLKSKVLDIHHKGVALKVNAKSEFLEIRLSDELLAEKKDKFEKIILEALQQATKKSQEVMAEESKKVMGDMKIPGLM